jgi:glycosyltransferase involved in cell wall biosynthesis
MTAHNSELFIAHALASLRAQTIAEWECVVVDDGSTDSTAAAVERLVDEDARIRLVRGDHRGVSHARNIGLASLTVGVPYVALLDSDDCYLPNALESLVEALDNRPDAVGVYGLAEYMDEHGRPISPGDHPALQRSRRVVRRLGLSDVDPAADSTFADLSVTGAIWPAAVGLHRRRIIEAVGSFDASFTRQGDWELYLRMSRRGPFPPLDQQVAWYRRHDANLTGDAVESCYQRERVRRKTWKSPTNTAAQRRTVARGARRIQLVEMHRIVLRLAENLRKRRGRLAAENAVGLALVTINVFQPGPPTPSLRRARRTRKQTEFDARR